MQDLESAGILPVNEPPEAFLCVVVSSGAPGRVHAEPLLPDPVYSMWLY